MSRGSLKSGVGRGLWVSQIWLRWLGFELVWIVVGCGGSRVEDRGGSVGLEFWVLWFFFFGCCDRCLKEEVGLV